jgi:Domain of unknown function (DUF6398)
MLLSPLDVELFFKLHRTLMFFVNQRLRVVAAPLASPEEFAALSPEIRLKVRDAFLDHTNLIESFVAENPAHLSEDELAIVQSWRHLVAGKFYVFRELKKYTVFLSTDKQPIAYGVLALSQPFEELIGPYLPVLVETVLMPFRDKIVYEGLLNAYRISFGPGIRRSLNESFKEAKERHGIVTSLPMSNEPLPVKAPKATPVPKPPSREEKDEALHVIIGLIDQFCKEHLNEEYALLCRKLAEKLARKRPSPLLHGSPNTWASGIVRTIGWVNFLGDSTQTPHMKMTDIDQGFGVSPASGSAKSKAIRDLLKMRPFDPNWTLPSRLEDNPMVWMLQVNGFMVDVRHAPREVQQIAFKKGLIPYIPADRRQGQE